MATQDTEMTPAASDDAVGNSVPDAAVVSLLDAVSHALDSTQPGGEQQQQQLQYETIYIR